MLAESKRMKFVGTTLLQQTSLAHQGREPHQVVKVFPNPGDSEVGVR